MSIENELGMSTDDFGQQKVYNEKESIVQTILNILFMKPGNLPNLPHIGLDISQYLYQHEDGIDTWELRTQITSQCSELLPYLISGDVVVTFTEHESIQMLLIGIPITIRAEQETLVLGLSPKSGNSLYSASEFKTSYQYIQQNF